jgi:antitoxin CcdA
MGELTFEHKPARQPVNLSLCTDLVARAGALTPNLSGTVEALLTDSVAKADAQQRADDAALDQVIEALKVRKFEFGPAAHPVTP